MSSLYKSILINNWQFHLTNFKMFFDKSDVVVRVFCKKQAVILFIVINNRLDISVGTFLPFGFNKPTDAKVRGEQVSFRIQVQRGHIGCIVLDKLFKRLLVIAVVEQNCEQQVRDQGEQADDGRAFFGAVHTFQNILAHTLPKL